eukprot:g13585.t1
MARPVDGVHRDSRHAVAGTVALHQLQRMLDLARVDQAGEDALTDAAIELGVRLEIALRALVRALLRGVGGVVGAGPDAEEGEREADDAQAPLHHPATIARRARGRQAAQGRPEAGETLDDRLAVFTEAERDRRAAAADDFAALMQSRTGRLHVLRLAGTALESVARPLVERELQRLRAERTPLTREDDPPEEDEEPPRKDPPTPSEQVCIERYAAIRRAKQRRDEAKAEWGAMKARRRRPARKRTSGATPSISPR